MAGTPLEFGPATVTLFGVVVPVFPALAGMLSVYLARLIAPKQALKFTTGQRTALVGLLMLIELAAILQFELNAAKATITGMTLGWMGLLVPEKISAVVWTWFKDQIVLAFGGQPKKKSNSDLPPEERKRIAQKIFSKVYPTEPVPDDLEEIVERLKQV